MAKRQKISENIKRSVLIESGHRCAIPTCRATEIDIHHIIEISKGGNNQFDNLIVLCPNCHRRVHNGAIDNKSLRIYKMNLRLNPKRNYKLHSFFQLRSLKPPARISIEYPLFNEQTTDYLAINKIIASYISENKIDVDTPCEPDIERDESWWTTIESEYSSTFKAFLIDDNILSIRFYYYWYGAGAAHGNNGVKCLNFFLNPLTEICLQDLFIEENAIQRISKYSIRHLLDEKDLTEDDGFIEGGAGPDWSNFDQFSISEEGIWIYFGPYQVGCFAEGEREVFLTKRFLESMMDKTSPLFKIWFPHYFK